MKPPCSEGFISSICCLKQPASLRLMGFWGPDTGSKPTVCGSDTTTRCPAPDRLLRAVRNMARRSRAVPDACREQKRSRVSDVRPRIRIDIPRASASPGIRVQDAHDQGAGYAHRCSTSTKSVSRSRADRHDHGYRYHSLPVQRTGYGVEAELLVECLRIQ